MGVVDIYSGKATNKNLVPRVRHVVRADKEAESDCDEDEETNEMSPDVDSLRVQRAH